MAPPMLVFQAASKLDLIHRKAASADTEMVVVGYRGGIGDEQAVELMVEMVRCAMVGD
jgi:hypothetical protein